MPDVARETRDHPPKRLMGYYDICQTPLFLGTNGKRPVHLTYDFSLRHYLLTYLLREANLHLFRKMTSNSWHSIHQLLPPTKVLPMKLRDYRCVFALPQCHYNLYKHSFVLRNLFLSAY